jgi:hypothetical protein
MGVAMQQSMVDDGIEERQVLRGIDYPQPGPGGG